MSAFASEIGHQPTQERCQLKANNLLAGLRERDKSRGGLLRGVPSRHSKTLGAQLSLKMSDVVIVCTTGLKLILASVIEPVSGSVLFP